MTEALPAVFARHRVFIVLLLIGIGLRVAATVAYYPALAFYGDSLDYLKYARAPEPYWFHPLGYSLFLWPLVRGDAVSPIPIVQHILGLAVAFSVYVGLLRLGVGRGWAAVATVPFLLDASFIVLEQNVLAETSFVALLLGALALLLLPDRPGWRRCALAGLLLAVATLFRTVGLLTIPVAVAVILLRRLGWRPALIAILAGALPLVAYASWYDTEFGRFALEGSDARLLYGRLAVFVQCTDVDLPASERPLCPGEPLARRHSANYYTWDPRAPVIRYRPPPGRHVDAVLRDFDHRALRSEPLAYAASVADYTGRYLTMTRIAEPADTDQWTFDVRPPYSERIARSSVGEQAAAVRWSRSRAASPAGPLRAYGRFALTPGPVVLLALLLSFAALALGRRVAATRRAAIVGLAGAGLLLLVGSAATSDLDARYLVPVVAMTVPAGVLAVDSLVSALRAGARAGGR